jgi:hypothetical protein
MNSTTNLSSLFLVNFSHCWVGQGNAPTNTGAVLIRDTGMALKTHDISFDGCLFHGRNLSTGTPVIDLEDDTYSIQITGSKIQQVSLFTNDTGILVNSSGIGGLCYDNFSSNYFGFNSNTFTTGISITGSCDSITIVGNNFTNITNAISWTGGAGLNWPTRAMIKSNEASGTEYDDPVLWDGGAGNICTGFGAGATCQVAPGSSLTNITIVVNTGTGPGSSGAVSLRSGDTSPINGYVCSWNPANLSTATYPNALQWNSMAGTQDGSGGLSGVNVLWGNGGVSLTDSKTYGITGHCSKR